MLKFKHIALILGLSLLVLLGGTLLVRTVQSQDQPVVEEPRVGAVQPQSVAAPSAILFSYQGRLLDKSGKAVDNTAVPMIFEIFAQASGGSSCWREDHTGGNAVQVVDGVFQVTLGQLKSIGAACVTGDSFLELTVNGEVLSPRERLTAVATAVQAVTSDSAIIASTAAGLTDGARAAGRIIAAPGTANLFFHNPDGGLRLGAGGNIHILIDSDNSSTDAIFTVTRNNHNLSQPAKHVLIVEESGNTTITGNLNLQGSCVQTRYGAESPSAATSCSGGNLTTAAVIEANLQTADELNSERIGRFSEGDVLCWAGEQLEKCDRDNDRLVQAVASYDGKPIVIGAERIRVLGPVEMGDILVSSSTPGYAMVNNDPALGTVIAQALEDLVGESGLIKAMIRKW